MKKRQLGQSDIYVSEISLGCMSLGKDLQHAKALIDRALDAGINYLDTADLYDFGVNEQIVGEAIKGKRQELIIGTKVGNRFTPGQEGWTWDPSKEHIKTGVKDSLKRLKTDYIDLYQLHGGTIEDPIDETIEAFEDLKKDGLIREYGISSIRPNVIKEFVKKSSMVSVMMQYSALDRRPEEEILDLLYENKISVLARGPLAKGLLSSDGIDKANQKAKEGFLDYRYEEIAQITEKWSELSEDQSSSEALALHYVLQNDAVASAVFGASGIEQLERNLGYIDAPPLPIEKYEKIQQLTKANQYDQHR